MNYRLFFIVLICLSINAQAQLHPIATNVQSLATDEPNKLMSKFDMNTNGCLRASTISETCSRLRHDLSGRKFDETVTLPTNWGHSIEERRRVAEETYKMEFSPSFAYRVKSCFGFCTSEEKKQDTLSITDGSRSSKESGAVHDTIGDSERIFYDGTSKGVSK